MTANVPVKFLFEGSNNMNSGDDTAKKGTQLSCFEESCINKESEQLFIYIDMISLYLHNRSAVRRLKFKL